MTEAVESALADRKHLMVEAGTGTGKTLAYLVPAILSGKRIIVSTGTKNLQEQLFYKDIPFLQKHFPRPIQVCYMKGRGNYACRQKIYEAENEAVLDGFEEVADFQIIHQWEKTTEFGDRAEIKTLPESSSAWIKIDARRELCTNFVPSRGSGCLWLRATSAVRPAYRSGNGLPASAGRTCAVTHTGVVPLRAL